MWNNFVHQTFTFLAVTLLVCLGLAIIAIVIAYFLDRTQSQSTIRRNYPVIGRFRYLFEHLGEFFRQYFFAMDREELPFNRAIRSWVYRASKGVNTTIAFGSSRSMTTPGEPHFLNSAFPTLDEDATAVPKIVFGATLENPFETTSFFNISGMSYGALSQPAVTALSRGAARAGCWLNTGEGGLSPHHLAANADIVFQIGTAKYGVRDDQGQLCETKLAAIAAKPSVKMFEIKLSQGAKPGKGGILPAAKVTDEIAAIRGIPAHRDSISPNRHKDAPDTESLLKLVHRVRSVTQKPTGIKFVLGAQTWLDELCSTMTALGDQYQPDFITLDGADGGTGAAPQPLMDYMGLPLRESLPLLVDALERHGLRHRIKIIASGKLVSPAYVALALAMGADVVVSARGFMFALGCIQAMQCHNNTCPTGVTTHNLRLQKGLDPSNKATRVANYHHQMMHDVALIAHSVGVKNPLELKPSHVRLVNADGYSNNIIAKQG